ncbi:hypothetical protein HGB07_03485, partial [Candidatus Roizmanbacteria bacterium]|nr:hypothetical protein [Candidatus Roizmanbacteria bacterium]
MDRKVRLETIKQLRIYVASTLAQVLTFYLRSSHPVSETQFRDGWLKELRKNKDIYTDGWYIPPPHGMILIFDTDDNGSRVGASSFRPPDLWPKGNIYLDKQKGLIYAYFSAVHRESGILGDFCVSLYLGTNKDVCLQMQKGLMIDRQIFDFAASGMKLCE